MTRLLKYLLLAAVVLLAFSQQPANGQIFGVQVDPELKFHTLATEHFRIHFHQGMEDLVYEVAQIAEESYAVILQEFGEAPKTLDVVLLDAFDLSNGSSNPIYDLVILIPSQNGLSNSFNVRLDSWWRMLIFHELVHAIELEMTQGIAKVLRTIFGKLSLPNFIKPIPFIEGLAVYEKYKHLGESRHNDSRTRMIIRQMVLDNNVPRFDEIKQFYLRTKLPSVGFLVYNFGSWLMRYIEENYGNDAMKRFDQTNAGNLMNVFFFSDLNETIEKTFGITADDLYAGFRLWLKAQFSDEITQIQEQRLTEATKITNLWYSSQQPAWSPDGKWIAYTHTDLSRGDLRLITPLGEEDHEIVTGSAISHPNWSADGNSLVYTKLDYDSPYYLHGDIYVYDIAKKTEKKLTVGTRAYFAQFTPDGNVLYAHNIGRDGSTALSEFNVVTDETRLIKEFPDADGVIHSFALSPDGDQIAMALLKRGGYQDIYLMPAAGGDLTPVTQNKDQEMSPIWTPDGQYILFTTDPERVYNLYAYQVSTGTFFKVTNMMSGAFTPTVSPDGKEIAFVSYDSNGYNIHRMPFDPGSWISVTPASESIPEWQGYPPHTLSYQPYNSFAYLLPKGWLPLPTETGLSVIAFGADPLLRHIYSASLGWDFEKSEPTYTLVFQHNASFPITLALTQSPQQTLHGISATVPLFVSLTGSQSITLGYQRSRELPETDNEVSEETEDNESTNNSSSGSEDSEPEGPATPIKTETLQVQYQFSQTRANDLFTESTNVTTSLDLWNHEGSNQWFKRLVVDWREGFALPDLEYNTLHTRVAAGWTDGVLDDEKFELGGHMARFSLRGFAAEAFTGKQAITGTFQGNFGVATIEQAIDHWPVFLDDLGVNLFVEAGMASDQLSLKEVQIGFGAELTLTATISYFAPLTLIFGIGQGLGEPAPIFYFNVGIPGIL